MDTHDPLSKNLRKERKRRVWRRIKLAIVLAVPALLVWAIFLPHVTKTSGPVSLDQADGCPIPLPQGAKNIRFYKLFQFNSFVEFVKFEAPADVCLEHIKPTLIAWGETFDYLRDRVEPVRDLEKPPYRNIFAEEFGVTWFDPHTIRKGVIAGGGGSGIPTIWVDTERGVFYYQVSD